MIALLLTVVGLRFADPPSDDVRRALAEAYSDSSIQREWSKDLPPPREESVRDREPSGGSGGGSPALLWILAAVGLGVLATLIARERLGRPPREEGTGTPGVAGPVRGGAGPPAIPSGALAASGRWAEAIHALWLETLAESGGAALAPALTSREALARVPAGEEVRRALARLVTAVEVSLFGGRPTGEREWLECLQVRDAARAHQIAGTA